ncbi:putative RNA-binding protein 18 isoform X1 [Lycorma delicatula]|uniref:putative RNA-binding protein 18 isoform X1 n=1 Tax=Lycorma delicatula TaxID=130591 RepID=UPI003F517762
MCSLFSAAVPFHSANFSNGLPRGYAFVSYTSKETAEKVRELLDGKKIGSKRIAVRWAHSMTKDEKNKSTEFFQISALTGAKTEKKESRSKTIQAIEAKLKMMEHNSNMEFELNINPSTSGNTSLCNNNNCNTSHKKICNDNPLRDRHKQKPYEKINK